MRIIHYYNVQYVDDQIHVESSPKSQLTFTLTKVHYIISYKAG